MKAPETGRPLLLAAALMTALTAGCSHPDPLVGTWTGTQTFQGLAVTNTWVLTADGKYTTTIQAASGPNAGMNFSGSGTYTVGNGTITDTLQSVGGSGQTRPVAKPTPTTYRYTLSGDTLTVSGPGLPGPLVLTRQHPL